MGVRIRVDPRYDRGSSSAGLGFSPTTGGITNRAKHVERMIQVFRH